MCHELRRSWTARRRDQKAADEVRNLFARYREKAREPTPVARPDETERESEHKREEEEVLLTTAR